MTARNVVAGAELVAWEWVHEGIGYRAVQENGPVNKGGKDISTPLFGLGWTITPLYKFRELDPMEAVLRESLELLYDILEPVAPSDMVDAAEWIFPQKNGEFEMDRGARELVDNLGAWLRGLASYLHHQASSPDPIPAELPSGGAPPGDG